MKSLSEFTRFVNDVVNLNQSRIDLLEARVSTLQAVLRDSCYPAHIVRFAAQGSWVHRTIIKPPRDKDFDADLMLFVARHPKWQPSDYVNNLYEVLRSHGTYRDMISRGTRCLEVNYKGDFHLDLVPCIQDRNGDCDSFFVCNRRDNTFESTAPESYTALIRERNRLVGQNLLQKVIRLLKYQRDIKGTFSVKSILLTTLVGERITTPDEHLRDVAFPDLPTALRTIVGRLDGFLQVNPVMPLVRNPVLLQEDFNRHWTQERYESFRESIHRYSGWIDDAFDEKDRKTSISKWRKVFGEEFGKDAEEESAKEAPAVTIRIGELSTNIAEAVRTRGARILEQISIALPHVEHPRWLREAKQMPVQIVATEFTEEKTRALRQIKSGDILQKHSALKFEARLPGFGVPRDFDVKWRIVNT